MDFYSFIGQGMRLEPLACCHIVFQLLLSEGFTLMSHALINVLPKKLFLTNKAIQISQVWLVGLQVALLLYAFKESQILLGSFKDFKSSIKNFHILKSILLSKHIRNPRRSNHRVGKPGLSTLIEIRKKNITPLKKNILLPTVPWPIPNLEVRELFRISNQFLIWDYELPKYKLFMCGIYSANLGFQS